MPLDYEMEEGVAGAYHDPSIPEGEITWQYTVVPVDYQFKDIEYEILADLFLQDEDEEAEAEESSARSRRSALRSQLNADLWLSLENEAMRITGNENDVIDEQEMVTRGRRSKWYPSGTILYEDNATSTSRIIPLQGAKIIVKRWFTWRSDITDVNGYFKVGSFRGSKVKCAIKWERHSWDIRSGSYGQAWYSFESLSKDKKWNKTIRKQSTPLNWLYANVHRGALEYFYNYESYGINPPCFIGGFLSRLHIGAKDKVGRAHYFDFNNFFKASTVVIYSKGEFSNGGTFENDSRELFATTIHELAHVSHWYSSYSTGRYVFESLTNDAVLPESWAVGVEYTITNNVYSEAIVGRSRFPYDENKQDETLDDIQETGYTPIVIDMIDNNNQGATDTSRPNDRVSGYTLGQLEDALPGSLGSWWRWRTRLREMFDNPTDGDELDYLFREYYK